MCLSPDGYCGIVLSCVHSGRERRLEGNGLRSHEVNSVGESKSDTIPGGWATIEAVQLLVARVAE